jgi:hypothetical protein
MKRPIRRRQVLTLDKSYQRAPPADEVIAAVHAQSLVVYLSWPKLAILELLSIEGGHDRYATVGRYPSGRVPSSRT